MWLTKLADLADPRYGLSVRFESGWRTRGASGGSQMRSVSGVLWHHTAGARSGTYPSRLILREGRAGLSGPLCHLGLDRDGTVWVVGAGKANHAGKGRVSGVPTNGGNTRLVGIEMESAGVRPWDWTPAQLAAMPKLGAALSDLYGLSASQHWGHLEYSSTGKIDPAGLPGGMSGLRSRIAAVSIGGTVTDQAPEASGEFADVDKTQTWLTALGYDPGPIDGKYGARTEAATQAAQQDLGITPADGRPGPATRTHLEAAVSKLDKLDDIHAWLAPIHRGGKQITIRQEVADAKTAALAAREQTGPIRRGGKDVTLRQEVADAKTLALAAEARDKAILAAIQAAASTGTPIDLDAVTAAAEQGVARAIASISADVTVTVEG